MPFPPTIHSFALADLATVKGVLGITDTANDGILTFIINGVTDWFERITGGRRYLSTTHSNELFDGNGSLHLFTRNYPNVVLTSVEQRTSPTAFVALDLTRIFVDPTIGRITLEEATEKGDANYRLTYVAGYAAIPSDIQNMAVRAVNLIFETRSGAGISQESLGEYSVSFGDQDLLADDIIAKVVSTYKRYGVGH